MSLGTSKSGFSAEVIQNGVQIKVKYTLDLPLTLVQSRVFKNILCRQQMNIGRWQVFFSLFSGTFSWQNHKVAVNIASTLFDNP